ncbi:hypothetical protein Tco_0226064 [Tanacetum coccineum]
MYFRVPTMDESVFDLNVMLEKSATYNEIKADRNLPYYNNLKEYYHGSKCWFKDVWKRHNQTRQNGWDELYSLEGKDEISVNCVQGLLCSRWAPTGAMTEEEERKREQDETLCR